MDILWPVLLAIGGLVIITVGAVGGWRAGREPGVPRAARRRTQARYVGVGVGVGVLLGSVAVLPLLPWPMGIVSEARHVYISAVPDDNKGAYLITPTGVMELFPWYVQPPEFPADAPILDQGAIRAVAVVQSQFDTADKYQLYNITQAQWIGWGSVQTAGRRMTFGIGTALDSGDYMLIVPSDSMYGGTVWHYFSVR